MDVARPVHLQFDAYELDEAEARLTREGVPIALPPKAFTLLCELAREPGRLITKDALLDRTWGHRHVSESVLKSTIMQVRAALDDDARQPRYIETAARRGYRFIGAKAAPQEAIPAPARATPGARAPVSRRGAALVGRRAELDRLHAAWTAAAQGRRQMVWVAGEAGVGKTTLIDTFIAELGDAVSCAHGQCVEQFGSGEPYLPILDALASLCRQDTAVPGLLRRVAPTWLLQLPWLCSEAERAALQRELAGSSQDRMLRELVELLDQVAVARPLLLAIEDLHWSDHATVRLIDHAARRRTPARLLWIGSYRLAELVASDHPLKGVRHELRVHRLAEEILLESFSETEVADYVERRFPGTGCQETLVQALHMRTDGLPLFLVNVIDDLLSQSGTLDAGALGTGWALPEGLAGVIERQVERLPADTQSLLAAASACGVEFRADVLAAALQRDEAGVQETCDRLSRARQWLESLAVTRLPDGRLDVPYAFRHALYRQVLYERLGAAARIEAHRRIGHALRRRRDAGIAVAATELAMHFELGQDTPAALAYLTEASTSALGHFAPLEAARHAEHALAMLEGMPPSAARLEQELSLVTLRGVANAQRLGVASPDAIESLERARLLCEQLPPTPERAWVQSGLGWICYSRGEFAEARALAARIHDQAQASDDRVLLTCALNLWGVTACNDGHLREARERLEEGLAMALTLGERLASANFVIDPEVSIRANLCLPLHHLGLRVQAQAQLEAAHARASILGQPMALMLAHWCGCMLDIALNRPDRLQPRARALAEIVERHAVAQGEGPSLWYLGWAEAMLGEPRKGHRMILDGYQRHARFGMYAGCPLVLGYAADALAQAGDIEGALVQFDEALALARRIGECVTLPELLLRRGRVQRKTGDATGAQATLRAALDGARRAGALGLEVDALVLLCDPPLADPSAPAALRALVASLPEEFDDERRAAAGRALARP